MRLKAKDTETDKSKGELPELGGNVKLANQDETGTQVVLYLHYATTIGYKNAVFRTLNTDIFVICITITRPN